MLSVVIITKNEARNIRDCLDAVKWADELIVVDAESTDGTVELARTCTDKVFVQPWLGFGPQKNAGIDKASGEWILIVDADERVTETLRDEILSVLRNPVSQDVAGFEVPRRNFFYGGWIRGGGLYPDYQLRLFRRSAGHYDDTALHERLRVHGRIQRLQSPMDHHSMPTIAHHVAKMRRYTTLGAQEKLKTRSRVTLLDLAGRHLVTVVKTYVIRGGFRDGLRGLIAAGFAGMHTFVKYAKAWERLHGHRHKSQS